MKTKTQLVNRILSLALALLMVLGMLPTISFTASAAEPEYDGVIGELYYKVDKENNVTTIFGNGALGSTTALANVMTSNVVIEEGVTSIGNIAFRGLSSLEKLTVKGDVTIGNYAFQGCASLETITFMGNVTSVGRNAFYGCASLTNINYYGTTEPSYTNALSYITLYSSNGVPFCGLTPMATDVSYAASVTTAGEGGVTENYSSLTDAITAAQENAGSTLKLLEDVDTNVVIDGGTFTFDLNGHKIEADTEYHSMYLTKSYALTIETGADITLKGSGSIISNSPLTHTTPYGCIWNKGKLKIDGDIELKTNEYTYNSGIYNAPGGQLTIDNCSINVKRYAIDCYKSTATINGGSFQSAGTCLYVSGDASVTVKGGSFTGGSLDLSVIAPATLKLGVGDDGPGPVFPGGILAYNTVVLRDLLDENCYFEQNGAPVDMTDITNKITGDVSVVYCDHSQNTNTIPTADDASSHSLFCSDCGARISQKDHSLNGGICTDCGYGCSHSSCITENNVTKCAHCPVVFVAQVGDAYFAKLSDAVAAAHGTKGSTLTLLADVKGDFAVNAGSVFTLDLNGKTLRGTSHGSIITINTAAELTIKSSVSGGKITGCDNQTVLGTIFVYGTLKLESGKITGNSAEYGGGVVVGGTFVMNGGEITGNTALYYGGGVYVTGEGSFTMNGGSITNNTVTADGTHMQNEESIGGGGVSVAEGTFTMNDGTISGNNASYSKGGGVMVSNYLSQYGSFVMNGGTITGNSAGRYGGGVYLMDAAEDQTAGSFTVNGNSVISGNTVKGVANNVYLEIPLSIGSNLSTTASIGITGSTTPTDAGLEIASSGATERNKSAFVCDNSNYTIVQKDGKLYLYSHIHSWIYTADDFVLTETCANNCGHRAIASIVAGEALYTGSAITNSATISYDSGTWAGDKPVLSFENNVNVGTATAKMTAGGATASTTFKINPANISYATVTLDPENGTYNGSAYAPAITVIFNGATLVKDRDYTLSWDKSGFTNADTYTVRVVGINNFTGYLDKTFNINAANLADVKVEQVGTLTYTGEALTPAVSANAVAVNNQPITFTYSTESEGPYSTEIPSFTNAGWAHTVYYIATADNHNTYYGSFLVEIEKATVIEPTIATKPYTGSEQTADVTDTDFYTVVKNEGGTGVKENGFYDVVLELKDSANYKWSTTDNPQVTLQFKITRAENEWTVDPSITGWTYGEAAKAPVGEAKFGEVSVGYSGTMNGGAAYNGVAAPTEAGSYTATFIVQETEDYKGLETSVDFTIAKADQAAPTGLTETDTTYFGKADGKISGLTSAMEFRKEGDSAYTAGFNGGLIYLAAGTYYVRYPGDANHNPSPDAIVTVNAGRKLQIVVPQNQVGYTVTVNKTEMEYEGSYTLKVEIHEGYTATEDFKIIISNWERGQQAGVEETYTNAIADQIIEVRGVADITPPAAEIKVKENSWTSFQNDLIGLFFKEAQDVTITANDVGSGVKTIQYYLSVSELERGEAEMITDWVDYTGTFKINPDNRCVVYAKVTDNDGNVTFINSEGIILDAIVPVIEGIENGKTYYTLQRFTVKESNLESVTVNGNPSMTFALGGNVDKTYVIVATDKAGNTTTVTVTMKPISDLSKPIDTVTKGNVNSSYKQAVDGVKAAVAAVDIKNATDAEKEALKAIVDKAAELEKVIDDTVAENKRISNKVGKYDIETVTSDDKEQLEQLLSDIQKQLKSTNLTRGETSKLKGEKTTVEDLLAKIKDTGELIDRLTEDADGYNDETVKSTDKDAIEQIIEDIDALLETENLTEDEEKTLEDAKAKAEDLRDTIEDAAEATDTENTAKVEDVTEENVTPENKTDLEKAKTDLEKALEDNDGNYTEDEKKAIEDEVKRIEQALEVVSNVEAVEEKISNLPDTVKKNDEAAVKAADEAYNALSDYEKSLVDEEVKKSLDNAKADIERINRWTIAFVAFALIIVILIIIFLLKKKKKEENA